MPYGNITLLSQIVTGQVDPADSEAANQLAAAVRQVKQFLGTYLAVSHDDTGALKFAAVQLASQVAEGIITGAKLASGTVELVNMGSDSVDTPQLVDDAVMTDKLATNAVTNPKLAALSVNTSNLIDDAVVTAKIIAGAVTNEKIAAAGINADKISGDGVSFNLADRMGNGTLPATKLAAIASNAPGLAVVMTAASSNVIAQIGGMLSATLDSTTTPPTLKFTLGASTAGETATLIRQTASGQLTAATWNVRGSLTRVIGDDTIIKVSGANTIQIVNDGVYLVFVVAMGYSCGLHQIIIEDDGTPAQRFLTGTTSYAGVGQQTESFGVGVVDVDGHDVSDPLNLQLKHWSTLTDAAGMGRTGLTDDWTASVLLIGVA